MKFSKYPLSVPVCGVLVLLLTITPTGCGISPERKTGADEGAVLKGYRYKVTKDNKIKLVKDDKVLDREQIEELAREGEQIRIEDEKTPGEEIAEAKAAEAARIQEDEKSEELKNKLEKIAEKYKDTTAPEEGEGEEEEELIPIIMGPPAGLETTAPTIFEEIRGTKSYKLRIEGGLIRLYYRLKYLPTRTAKLSTPAARENLVVQVSEKKDADLTKTLEVIKDLLNLAPDSGEGAIYYPDNDMLVVTTTEEKMRVVEELLKYVVDVPRPQVRISAIVSEITNSDDFQLGVRYSILGKSDPATTNIFERLVFNLPPRNFQDLIVAGTPVAQFEGGAVTFSTAPTSGEGSRIEEITMQALVDAEYAEIVSRPNITVRVGQTARILTGQEVPVASSITVNNVITTSVKFKEVGVKLYITPISISKDTVTLHIAIEVSTVIGFIDVSPNFPAQPNIQTRFSETTVRVRDGTKLLIAGLTTNDTINNEIKIPLLGDIPFVGYLFKSVQKIKRATELMFLITPEIEPEAFVEPAAFED